MKTELASKVRLVLMASAFLPVATACAVEADSFKIDFGIHNGGSPVAEGWNVFGWSVGNNVFGPSNLSYVCSNDRIATNGVVTVGVTARSYKITARNREQPSDAAVYPMAPVYCDWISSDSSPMWITLSGLHPQTIYRFKAYAYDNNNTKSVTFHQWSNGKDFDASVSIAYQKGTEFTVETSPDIYAAELEIISDRTGSAEIHITSTALISGFELMRGRDWDPLEILVDFGDSTSAKLQPGACQFYASESEDPRTCTFGALSPVGSSGEVTVTLSRGVETGGKKIITRDRDNNGSGAICAYREIYPCYNLVRDLLIAQVPSMWIDVKGLAANAKYQVVLSPYDYNYSKTYTLADWTTGEEVKPQSLTTTKELPLTVETPRDIYAFKRTAKADANGHLKLKLSSNSEVGIAWLELKYLKPTGIAVIVR